MIHRSNILRPMGLFIARLGVSPVRPEQLSYQDWPSHAVFPYPAIQNVCGPVGVFVAYYCFLAIGQGVFPLIFFSGVCLAVVAYQKQLTDVWLRHRLAGPVDVRSLRAPFQAWLQLRISRGSRRYHRHRDRSLSPGAFHTIGTRLVLMTAIFVGMLLAADDLVLRPGHRGPSLFEHADGLSQN